MSAQALQVGAQPPFKVAVPKPLRVKAEMRLIVPPVTSQKSASEIAARLGNVPVRTVENWQQGRCLPDAPYWEALKDIFPEFRAKDREWAAEALGVEPLDELRLLQEVQRLLIERQRGNGK